MSEMHPRAPLLPVREICANCPVPVYAIGGINEERLPQVMEAGAAGGCMMSGFMRMKEDMPWYTA